MKKILYTLLLALLIIGCASGTKKMNTTNNKPIETAEGDTIRIANDSLEYEIIIIEPGFNNWLATQPPRGYLEQFTLENRNRFYVVTYNNRVMEPSRYDPLIYQQQIDYNRNTDYGYEVNYLLYNWFEYFQKRYNQKL